MKKAKPKKTGKTWLKVLLTIILLPLFLAASINLYIFVNSQNRIFTVQGLEQKGKTYDVILVLGAAVTGNQPSGQLESRLDQGIALYKAGLAPKLLMSGDNGGTYYNEPAVMKDYALKQGVPAEDIFLDHYGFSTYESIIRAREIYQAKSMIIVSQPYHLARALYLADRVGIDSVASGPDANYRNRLYYAAREALAQIKDFFVGLIQPQIYVTGTTIPLAGSGEVSW